MLRVDIRDLQRGPVRTVGELRPDDPTFEGLGLDLAGPDTTVILCSDHGFESGSQRPRGTPREPAGPAAWHRQYGIFVMAGPGIRRDERIYGASLIDIAPTVLTLFDLPIGQDMDGRPLLEAFEEIPNVKTIPSWEQVEGESDPQVKATAAVAHATLVLAEQVAVARVVMATDSVTPAPHAPSAQ